MICSFRLGPDSQLIHAFTPLLFLSVHSSPFDFGSSPLKTITWIPATQRTFQCLSTHRLPSWDCLSSPRRITCLSSPTICPSSTNDPVNASLTLANDHSLLM